MLDTHHLNIGKSLDKLNKTSKVNSYFELTIKNNFFFKFNICYVIYLIQIIISWQFSAFLL